MKIFLFGAASAISLAAAVQPACAQTEDAADGAGQVQEVVVTGSRVIRDGSAAPTPVTVVSAGSLATIQPVSIAEGLKTLPQFQNSSGDRRKQAAAGSGQPGNFLNLRGLGANRSLVLMDGRRVPATSNDGAVDTNVIPELLVQRVDVVTGGASAAYGSDAVSGVVNFILDRDLVGFKAVAQGGVSTYNDGATWRVGAAYGAKLLDGRLHFVASAEHSASDPVKSLNDRPLGRGNYLFTGAGTVANPWTITANTRYGNATNGGLVSSGPLAGQQFLPGGVLAAFSPGTPTGLPGASVGGQGAVYGEQWLSGRLIVDKVFGRAAFELTDDISVWAQGNIARSSNYIGAGAVDFRFGIIPVFSGNAFLAPSAQAAFGTLPSVNISRISADLGPAVFASQSKVRDFAAGIDGRFGDDWSWNLLYTRGRADTPIYTIQTQNDRFYAAIDAVRDATGAIVCRVSITNPGLYPGCTPLNILGEGGASAAAVDYVRQYSRSRIINTTSNIEASIHGSPFSLWAGPVDVAAGAQYRQLKLTQTSTADPAKPPSFAGIRGVPAGLSHFFSSNSGTAFGTENVTEFFGEIAVPLAKDLPFAQTLDVNLAGRSTDYKTSGKVTTWKIGGSWSPVDDIRVRVTRSRDIRAPSLFDLYAGTSFGAITTFDPHTNTSKFLNSISGGNLNLKPEKGDTKAYGVVVKPRFLPGLTGSLDYYDISIDGAITTISTTVIMDICEASNGTAPECALIDRPFPFSNRTPDNFPSTVRTTAVNAAAFRVRGYDFDVSYQTDLADIFSGLNGNLTTRVLGSYLKSRKSQLNSRAPVLELAGQSGAIDNGGGGINPTSYPKIRMNVSFDYTLDNLNVTLTQRFIGSMKQSLTQVVAAGQENVKSVQYTDFTIKYKLLEGDLEPFFTINNLFNKQPPLIPLNRNVPGAYMPTNSLLYDTYGRYFTAGVRMHF